MKYQNIGWLADMNHATIIYAENTIKDMIDIEDPQTMGYLDLWTDVFIELFGIDAIEKSKFTKNLNDMIKYCGLSREDVHNVLIDKASEYEEEGFNDVSSYKASLIKS